MRKTDTFIVFGLLITGILIHPVYQLISGEFSRILSVIGFVCIGLSLLYQFYALYRNKQYSKLKWQVIRVGVMIGVLLLLALIWGRP